MFRIVGLPVMIHDHKYNDYNESLMTGDLVVLIN